MKTIAVIQARMSSTRLPGKVLSPVADRPMIALMVERVRKAHTLNGIVLAISTNASDDALETEAQRLNLDVWRGPERDVLARFAGAAEDANADLVVRLTGDCPLIDPEIIDEVVAELTVSGADYCSNIEPRR